MEIILQHAKMKKKKYYLYDNFDDSFTKAFHELKGRHYKKENYWVFPIQNILPSDTNFTDLGKSNVPETTTDVPETISYVPETISDVPETITDVPETKTVVPETITNVPETTTDVPETITDIPETITDVPPTITDVPETTTDVPETKTVEPNQLKHDFLQKYLYNPPIEMFHFVKPYTMIAVSST